MIEGENERDFNKLFWTGYKSFRLYYFARTVLYDRPDTAFFWDYCTSFFGWYRGNKYKGVWL